MAQTPRRNELRAEAEHRWPVAVAMIAGIALYATLPSSFTPTLRYAVVVLIAASLLPLVLLNPHRLSRETRWSRALSTGGGLLLLAANQFALVQLVIELVSPARGGPQILLAALQVWSTNVIAFALVYWEIDRGGPVARRREAHAKVAPADFRFPQDEDRDAIDEVAARSSDRSDWMPGYPDYLYVSLTNSMAFGPTDSMPLSHRAKALMGLQSFSGFVILALVIARAVSLLG